MEIRPLETDVVLKYCSSLCIRAFAQRLPDDEFNSWGALDTSGYDPPGTFIRDGVPQVYKYRSNPPGFIISPSFDGVQSLIKELDLPIGASDVYFSKLWSADEFVGRAKGRSPQYEEYSVETFGVRVTSLPSYYPYGTVGGPNPFNLPRYWLTPCLKLIQIRRLKVFNCPLGRLLQIDRRPLTHTSVPFLHLEERWHPLYWDQTVLGGLAGIDASSSSTVERFFRTAQRILAGDPKRGRPEGTRQFPVGREFYEIVRSAFLELGDKLGRPPLQKEVAPTLGLSPSGFKGYWRTTKRLWPPREPYESHI